MKKLTCVGLIALGLLGIMARLVSALDDHDPAPGGAFYDGAAIFNTSGKLDLTKLACAGVGSDTNSRVTVAEAQTDLVLTTLTLAGGTTTRLVATDGSAEGESLKLLDFDAGAFTVLGVIVDCTTIVSAGATNTYVLSLGTVAAADDATLTSTEVDLCPSTSINTTGGTVRTNGWNAILASPATFDGTTTAKSLYLNMGIADADMNNGVTNVLTGNIYIISTKAIDNQ